MRILWYNWRDIKNPEAGGAEVFTHEVCKRLHARKKIDAITLFTSAFEGALADEVVDGVRIVRRGHKKSVYHHAKEFYQMNMNDFDMVVDEINTKPFNTPTFVRNKPIIAVIHQLAREFWFYETKFPVNLIGYYIMEKYWLRKYRRIPTITVSNSTKDDLLKLGFEKISIVPEGISCEPLVEPAKKEDVPTLLFVGRLTKAKKPDDALRAFKIIKDAIPAARLWIVGDGYMSRDLQQEAIQLFGRERISASNSTVLSVSGMPAHDPQGHHSVARE
ncbi:MAG: glycosyltransferase family 4 protein [Nitrososphaera sp.]